MFNKSQKPENSKILPKSSSENIKNQRTQEGVKAEREGLVAEYNPDKKKPREGLWGGVYKAFEKFGGTDVRSGLTGTVKFISDLKEVLFVGKKEPVKFADNSVNQIAQRIVDENNNANLGKVDRELFTLPVKQERQKFDIGKPILFESPAQIEKGALPAIDSLKYFAENFESTNNNLADLQDEIDTLKASYNELSTEPRTPEIKSKLQDIASAFEEKGKSFQKLMRNIQIEESEITKRLQDTTSALKVILDREEHLKRIKLMSTETVKGGMQNFLVNNPNYRPLSVQDKISLYESVIPKLKEIGVTIDINEDGKKWDVKLPEFGTLVNNVRGVKTVSEEVSDVVITPEKYQIPQPKEVEVENIKPNPEILHSSKFKLNDSRFVEAGNTRIENINNVFSDDCNILLDHYNDEAMSDLNEADIKNLRERLIYSANKLANWYPEKLDNGITTMKFSIDSNFGRLKKLGFEFKKDHTDTKKIVVTDGQKIDKSGLLNPGILQQAATTTELDNVTENDNDETEDKVEVVSQIKDMDEISEIEGFSQITKNLSNPKLPIEVENLQKKIDKYLVPNHYQTESLKENINYLLGEEINGEMVFDIVHKDEFEKNDRGMTKLSIPEFISADSSFAAEASRNIMSNLNISNTASGLGILANQQNPPKNINSFKSQEEDNEKFDRFERYIEKMRIPLTVNNANLLQEKIDEFIRPAEHSMSEYYLIGKQINGELVYIESTDIDKFESSTDKPRIILPYFYGNDMSQAAKASRKIFDTLKVVTNSSLPPMTPPQILTQEEIENNSKQDNLAWF
jgi:hypothetical protein